jgi:hypothetical protein
MIYLLLHSFKECSNISDDRIVKTSSSLSSLLCIDAHSETMVDALP